MNRTLFSAIRRKLSRKPKGKLLPAEKDFALAVPFSSGAIAPVQFRIAVMIHLFHPELGPEFRNLCEAVPKPCDLLITTDTSAKADDIAVAFEGWSKGEVRIVQVPNQGRDIGPKLTAFAADYPSYDLLLFLHSKKSATVEWGDHWRHQITQSLCGSPAVVQSILTMFTQDKTLGMVAPRAHDKVRPLVGWGTLEPSIKLAKMLGVELDFDGTMAFPAGSMFWARPAALAPLLDLGLKVEDFPPEQGQTDATLAHAVERFFYIICEKAGFRCVEVADPHFFESGEGLVDTDPSTAVLDILDTNCREACSTMISDRAK